MSLNNMFSLLKWLWKARPISVIGLLLTVHLILIFDPEYDAKYIHKTFSLITQIFSGLTIWYSITSTIKTLENKTFSTAIADYLSELFRCTRKTKTIIETELVSSGAGVVNPRWSVSYTPQTIEENIKYLQEQIDRIKQDFEQETKEINERINQQLKEMKAQKQKLESISQNMNSMASKTKELILGESTVANQLLGILLVFYSAIAGYLA